MDKKELVFDMYKDDPIGIKWFRKLLIKDFNLNDRDISDIYAKIDKYQTAKYGARLSRGSFIDYNTAEEYEKRARIRRTARYKKKRNKGGNKDA